MEELAYRFYITDAVKLMGEGKYLKYRYYDVLHPQPVDERPAMEMATDILSRVGVEVIHTNGSI